MSFFDFLGGAGAMGNTGMGMIGSETGGGALDFAPDTFGMDAGAGAYEAGNSAGFMQGVQETFADPNFLRMLGEMGASMSPKGSVMEAVGKGASALHRNKAYQNAAVKGEGQDRSLMQMLREGKGLGPESDNETLDEITNKSNGDIIAKMKYKPPEQQMPGAEKPLESFKSFAAPAGRSDIDYSPFF